jgi:hypothetical protein
MADGLLPTCSRRGLALLLVLSAALALPACDSDDGGSGNLERVSGIYEFTQLRFDTGPDAVDDANVLGRIQSSSFEFLPGNGEFQGRVELENDDGNVKRFFVSGTYDVGGGEATLDIRSNDQGDRRRLLLPDQFDLNIQGDGSVLAAEIERDGVNLSNFSEKQYGGLGEIGGTLQIRLEQ